MLSIAYYYFVKHGILPWEIIDLDDDKQLFIKACYSKEMDEINKFISNNKKNPFANPGWITYFRYSPSEKEKEIQRKLANNVGLSEETNQKMKEFMEKRHKQERDK